jgi:hypothetical protein
MKKKPLPLCRRPGAPTTRVFRVAGWRRPRLCGHSFSQIIFVLVTLSGAPPDPFLGVDHRRGVEGSRHRILTYAASGSSPRTVSPATHHPEPKLDTADTESTISTRRRGICSAALKDPYQCREPHLILCALFVSRPIVQRHRAKALRASVSRRPCTR